MFVFFEERLRRIWAKPGIQFYASNNSGYNTADASYTFTIAVAGANRYLRVGVSMLSVLGASVSSISSDLSGALGFLGGRSSSAGAIRVELWGLIAPAVGTHTLTVTLSAALDSVAGADSWTGVHQTSPTGAFTSDTATNVGAADALVDPIIVDADNSLLLSAVATDDPSITDPFLATWNVTGALGSGGGNYYPTPVDIGSWTLWWTNVGALATWSIAGIALRPVAAADGGPIKRRVLSVNQAVNAAGTY